MATDKTRPVQSIKAPHFTRVASGPVTFSFRQTSGGAQVGIGIDYTKATPPDLSYVADHVEVVCSRSGYKIMFGKLNSDLTALRTRIEILFPGSMFQNQLLESTRNFLQELPASPSAGWDGARFPDPEKIQTFQSNNALVGAWADEGVADFYYLSPGDFGFAARNQLTEVRLIPSVRVTMDIQLIRTFLEQCHSFDTKPLR